MITQALGTFLLAWIIGVTAEESSLQLATLVALAIACLIKANGLLAKKKRAAIVVETAFVLAMVVVMILAHAVVRSCHLIYGSIC